MKYVIIGNSTAAIGCIEGIREHDQDSEITVISNEIYHTYGRPLISYLLCGKTTEENMKYRPNDFYQVNNCTTMFGKEVVAVDAAKKEVKLDDGETVVYDKLLIATGSRPFVPAMNGLDSVKNKFTFMTLDDAKAIDNAIDSTSKVLIVGAGLIGLKCAEGIRKKVDQITVVDLAPRILPSVLDEEGSKIMQQHIESFGIDIILSDSVKEFKPNIAVLNSGKEIEYDVVVIAVGVRPNTELLAEAGATVDKGILINDKSETSLTDIYAAGDCVVSHDITTNEDKILALLPNAYFQGYTAGINMAGGESVFDQAIPMNAMGFEGLHIITAGSYDGEEYIKQDENNYKKLVTKDGYLRGYILIGDVKRAGIYTSLIREQIPLDTIDFELIKEQPQLMAFNCTERAKILGGAQ